MQESPLVNKVLPPRRAASKASASFAGQLTHSDEDDDASPTAKGSTSRYGRSKGRRTQTAESPPKIPLPSSSRTRPRSDSTPESSSRNARSQSNKTAKKRPLTPTTVSSDDEMFPEAVFSVSLPKRSGAQKPSSSRLEIPPKFPRAPSSRALLFPPISSSSGSSSTLANSDEKLWSLATLGVYLWVLVDQQGHLFNEESTSEGIWWPAKKVSSPGQPFKLSLYGDLFKSSKFIIVATPSSENIQQLTNSLGRIRYDDPLFVDLSSTRNVEASPRKKRKRDRQLIEEAWRKAQAIMLNEKFEAEDDGLPEPGVAFGPSVSRLVATASAPVSPGKQANGKGKRKAEVEEEEEMEVDLGRSVNAEVWSPPDADFTLTIPGELVLARDKPHKTAEYWPAKVLNYTPPMKKSQAGKYLLKFLDGNEKAVPRDYFYASYEEGFATCKLGEFKSDVVDDPDDATEDAADDVIDYEHDRPPSPTPLSPPPSPDTFHLLSIHEQLSYTKVILQAVLNDAYPPARKNHDSYIAGGNARKNLVDEAGLRGTMDPREVEQLLKLLKNWCLRGEQRAPRMQDESELQENSDVIGESGAGPRSEISASTVDAVDEILPAVEMSEVSNGLASHEDSNCTDDRRSSSPTDTILIPASSPPALPPNSSFSTGDEEIEEDKLSPLSKTDSLPKVNGSSSLEASSVHPSSNRDTPVSSLFEDISVPHVSEAADSPPIPLADGGDLPSQQHPESGRLVGCPAYEALGGWEKGDYCLNVLLPEAILQILLWRSGDRTSVEQLSNAEERDLHFKGEALRKQTDFVFDVMRLRQSGERALKKKAGDKAGSNTVQMTGGTMSRPRRNTMSSRR